MGERLFNVVGLDDLEDIIFARCTTYEKAQKVVDLLVAEGFEDMITILQDELPVDVIEIDAASNNGVDNIREIVDEVSYSPAEGKYKVYIIDEVHMLSIGAFNALLKTLEEPPEYVIFILATTELHKLPSTIVSRCQRYDFRRILF